MTTVLLDCDDVLLDWIGGFRMFANEKLDAWVEGEPQSWHMGEWLGTTDEVAFELVQEFNASPAFGNLSPVKGAVELVHSLVAAKHLLHVVTSCSSDQATVTMRRKNLDVVFGPRAFESIHCLDLGEPKAKLLRAWRPGAVWVEDNYKNAIMGAECGHLTYLRARPHNAEYRTIHDERISWFTDMSELQEAIV